MEVFLGISAADGTGAGPAFVIPEPVKRVITKKKISSLKIEESWQRFKRAISYVTSDVELTVFTYDSDDDFDENKNYRGNSKYTVRIHVSDS